MIESTALNQDIEAAADGIRRTLGTAFDIVVVLGSGLAGFVDKLGDRSSVPYSSIPGFPSSTVPGHAGLLFAGSVGSRRVLCCAGRFHYYEGYDPAVTTLPVRAASRLGVRLAVFTNAAGGLSESLSIGDLMILDDHLNLLVADSPLRGLADDVFGTKFVNMYGAYDVDLASLLLSAGTARHLPVKHGVYAAVGGPQYETRAEIRMLRTLGADAVGMSTVHEVIVARQESMRVCAISVITDMATETTTELSHEKVVAAARKADGQLAQLLHDFIGKVAL
jgi:purine-nucleoside phosphorylase